ncbi:MAG: DNA polymerase III subunit gamma/tau [Candidatus Microsaccharimonas sossegonensis]|uniref:DNA polymerase III subunit gamma/tau n=1 Tax=Candidatus Microsaccharimonas sossegonensis TaxID=2506948 RepID=A0A4Q0AHP4_9BACT|nr:MAG: DNA polymerase III subunit gamma/tau [Candidatus Microsaccharimonas sossegonensis]
MSQALYRKYRSKSLDEVVGQTHITDILARAIKAGRISHAYLLTGPRGVGKTSVARILAHEINHLPYSDESTHLDIIEIDAASNNGVEDVRDLREKVQIAPVSAAKKVYIIDEVHMLSKAAFNALLKTLEEPPEHIVFILATTDVDKLPATIISRTQRYGFRAISEADAIKHLRYIADEEHIIIDDASLKLIANRGDGSFRDSISLLDQLANLSVPQKGITPDLIEAALGLAPTKIVKKIIEAVENRDIANIAQLLETTIANGISAVTLTEQLTYTTRDNIVSKPQLLPLLDGLLDVAKSSQPQLKLLAVLGSAALEHKPSKTAALSTSVFEVTATIEELSKQAVKAKPAMPRTNHFQAIVSPALAPEVSSVETLEPESTPVLKQRGTRSEAVSTEDTSGAKSVSIDFDWKALVEHTRQTYVALYSVLSKCDHKQLGNTLTLYTKSTFYKKKLDDQKYSSHLYEALKATGSYGLIVHTIPTPMPPRSIQAAAVAAMMGGGEEVTLS